MATPSLALIPSGYKAQKVYSVLPTNGDGDFTFARTGSATRVNENGLIETVANDVPRLDYSDGGCPSLLLEPQRTNLILTSAEGEYGSPPGSEANTISPDGTNNAVIPTPDAVANRYQHSIGSNTYATNTKLVYSWYRKRISTPTGDYHFGDLQFKNLVNVTQVGSTTQIQSDINGFDRFEAIINITDGSASSLIRAYFGNIIGIGNSSVAYFGHQLEEGEYASSYIPTVGSVVTRSAEVCNGAGNDQVINSSEGVLYAEIKTFSETGTFRQINLSNGTLSKRIYISKRSDNGNLEFRMDNPLGSKNFSFSVNTTNDYLKFAFQYGSNNFALYINGVNKNIATLGSTFSVGTLTDLDFTSAANQPFYGNIKDVRVYNNALSDSELQALTS